MPTQSAEEFLANETRILFSMEEKGKKARETGLVSKVPETGLVQAGYILYLPHSSYTCSQIQGFSEKVSKSLSGRTTSYHDDERGNNIHTTVATHDIRTSPNFKPDLSVLLQLTDIAEGGFSDFLEGTKHPSDYRYHNAPELEYERFIHDESTVVACPTSNPQEFCRLRNAVTERASRNGVELKPSWGRHITISRFKENISPKKMKTFNKLVDNEDSRMWYDEHAPGQGAQSLNVGYFKFSQNGFSLTPFSAFFFT